MARENRFGRVAVLMGGQSAEREISLRSGAQVLAGLQARGIDAHALDLDADSLARLQRHEFDRVFLILHGRGGEDGQIQGTLDSLGVPYTGSGVLGSALSMDKHRSKLVWRALGLPTPAWMILDEAEQCQQACEIFGLPLIVKPCLEGSSIGVTKVTDAAASVSAWAAAGEYGPVMAERCIEGDEYTVTVVGGEVLPSIRLATPRVFYDYEAKYFSDTTEYHCPSGLSDTHERQLAALCRRAFAALDAKGWGRIDLMRDHAGQFWLIELNTAPGMTDHSLVPMAARTAGLSFSDLVLLILEDTLEPAHE
ncbi:MAG: D-alanine--D-alanine ligase [Gammaproteobacteria bacterium]|nr:D-alanine--D-alanine ligase [Gammaproteobacteria bacterium]